MIPLWFANAGEDFVIEKFPERMLVITAENIEFNIKSIANKKLPVICRDGSMIYAVFAGKRLAFTHAQAMKLMGRITGKTETAPKIMSARAGCTHNCSNCKGCC